MGSGRVLKCCFLVGAFASSVAAMPAWATTDDSASGSNGASVQTQSSLSLIDHMRELFHRLSGGFLASEGKATDANAVVDPPEKLASLTLEQREQMRDQIRQQWQSASPEERKKHREEFRERWESATPEQREQIKERARDHWEQLSPEQRQQMRQNIEDRSNRSGAAGGLGGYGSGPGR